jgi:hypothetical protein
LLIEIRQRLTAIASYPGVRLWCDSRSNVLGESATTQEYAHFSRKQRIALAESSIRTAEGEVPLTAIYFLGPPAPHITIERLTPREAFLNLVQFTFTLDTRDAGQLQADFQRFATLVSRRVFFRLSYPRDWQSLNQVVAAVLEHARVAETQ